MNIILFDQQQARKNLFPFTLTNAIPNIRLGILTIKEKWQLYLTGSYSYLTEGYLSKKFPLKKNDENLLIDATILPNKEIVAGLQNLKINQDVPLDFGRPSQR